MRWIILLLLVVNGGYFYWSTNLAANADLNPVDASGAGQLMPGVDAVVEGQAADQDLRPTVELLPALLPAAEQQEAFAKSQAQLIGNSPYVAGSHLAGPYVTAAEAGEFDRVLAAGRALPFCWYIGFADQQNDQALSLIKERLFAVGIVSRLQEVNIIDPPGYLLYLPPYPSREKALERLQQLLADGHDAYIFERGELSNGISLDWYRLRQGAEQSLAVYRVQGIAAQLRTIEQSHSQRWLSVTELEHEKIVDRLWRRIIADWPSLIRQKNYCQSIAPAGDFE